MCRYAHFAGALWGEGRGLVFSIKEMIQPKLPFCELEAAFLPWAFYSVQIGWYGNHASEVAIKTPFASIGVLKTLHADSR